MKLSKYFTFFIFFWTPIFLYSSCPFCNPDVLTKQLVHETNHSVTLYCLTPATKGNLLILPKRHIERFEDLTYEEMQAIQSEINIFSRVFKKLYNIFEFVLLQKNGKKAGQSVAHLHFHMIPAPIPFHEIIDVAFHDRKRLSDEEMKAQVQELKQFLSSIEEKEYRF